MHRDVFFFKAPGEGDFFSYGDEAGNVTPESGDLESGVSADYAVKVESGCAVPF